MSSLDLNLTQYVPFLKAKAGEADALSTVPTEIRRAVTPLFDVPRPSRFSSASLDDQLAKSAKHIKRGMRTSRALFIDLFDIPLDARCCTGEHPLTSVLNLLKAENLVPIPVYGFDRDDAYLNALMDYPDIHGIGLCLRLDDVDISNLHNLELEITNLLNYTGIQISKIDLVIDLRSIIGRSHAHLRTTTIDAIATLTDLGRFRRVILSGSNFPRDVTPVAKDSIGYLRRTEYDLWRDVSNLSRSRCLVRFGDYSVIHPDFVDLGPVPNANAKIRYTLSDSWMIARGHQLTEHPGYQQYHNLAHQIASHSLFLGEHFSFGDQYISRCASRAVGTGNLRKWVGVDINHHIHLVSEQVVRHVRAERLPLAATA